MKKLKAERSRLRKELRQDLCYLTDIMEGYGWILKPAHRISITCRIEKLTRILAGKEWKK